MKKVVWKVFVDHEKEEKFLNEMSDKGWALTSFKFCRYTFEEAPKGEYIYRLEYLEHPIKDKRSQEYLEFMKETGAEVVATSLQQWVYFRKKSKDGSFTIYSDIQSKILHYSRLRTLYLCLAAPNILMGLILVIQGYSHISAWISPLNLIAGLLLISAALPLTKKISHLEKEQKILE